jgi:nitrite reductase (NO-forming)
VVVESAGAYPLVTHSLTGALRGAIAVLVVSPDAKPAPLMPMVPWKVATPQTEITPVPTP